MSIATTVHTNTYRQITGQENTLIKFENLPAGNYTYGFAIINPYASDFTIEMKLTGIASTPVQINGSGKINQYEVCFLIQNSSRNIHFAFRLLSGQRIFIKPAGSPRIQGLSDGGTSSVLMVHDMINNAFITDTGQRELAKDHYRNKEIYLQIFSQIQLQNKLMTGQNHANTSQTLFEYIDLPAAEKQLDYVVYHKLFAGKDGHIFKRMIRSFLGFFFRLFYRMITSSRSIKIYLAKLYRNYVNLNYLSERRK